jgi:hypothetical protein
MRSSPEMSDLARAVLKHGGPVSVLRGAFRPVNGIVQGQIYLACVGVRLAVATYLDERTLRIEDLQDMKLLARELSDPLLALSYLDALS